MAEAALNMREEVLEVDTLTDETALPFPSSKVVDVLLFSTGVCSLLFCADYAFASPAFSLTTFAMLPILIVLLLIPICWSQVDFFQSEKGVNLAIAIALVCVVTAAAFSFFSLIISMVLIGVAVAMLGIVPTQLFECFVSNVQYGILALLILATAAIAMLASAYFAEVRICLYSQIALLVIGCICAIVIKRSPAFECVGLVSKAESKRRSSEQRMWRRLISIGSWGVSSGVMFAALFFWDAVAIDKVSALGMAAFVAVWLLVLMKRFTNEYTVLPRFSGALMVSLIFICLIFDGWLQVGALILGIAYSMMQFAGLISALSERTRIEGVSALWVFGLQMGFWIIGGIAILAVANVLAVCVPGVATTVLCFIGIALTSFSQILVGQSSYPSDGIVIDGTHEADAVLDEIAGTELSRATTLSADYNSNIDIKRFDLSPRQEEVFWLLIRGRNIRYIADRLCVSESTVKTHVHNLYAKLGVHSQQELITKVEESLSGSE